MKPRRGLVALFALWSAVLGSLAWAAPCDGLRDGRITATLEGVGTAYFSVLDAPRLAGGVCVAGEGGWELRGETVRVEGVAASPSLAAENVTLSFAGWTLEGATLRADATELTLNDINFRSGTLEGRADAATFTVATSALELREVAVTGQGFRVQGATATLGGNRLVFQDALATTCVCADDALYVVRAPTASYDLTRAAVRIEGGKLRIGGVQVSLPNVEVTPEKLKNLTFPVRVEYLSDNGATGVRGTGLGIRVPAIGLGDGLELEVGAVGLDTAYPLNVVLVAHYRDDRLQFDVGRAARGVQADIVLSEALTPAVNASFAVRNRAWRDQDFLHEGVFALTAGERVTLFTPNDLVLGAGGFAAVSYQFLGVPVSAPRLGGYQELQFLSPPSRGGRFGVSARAELTTYPGLDRTQVGFGFRPSWAGSYGPLRVNLAWDGLWTNAASPFGVSLDRLEPRNLLVLSGLVDGSLTPRLHGTFSVSARYDLLRLSGGALSDGLDTVALGASLSYRADTFTLTPFFRAELAPLFNETRRGETDSFVETGLDLDADPWSFGLTFRADPLEPKITKLEARTSFPITLSAVTLKPFLAFDFAPTLTAGQFPRVSGHGLEVTYRSCCGTLVVGYRQLENAFTTSFAVRFE